MAEEVEIIIHDNFWNSYVKWNVPRLSAVAKQEEKKETQKTSEALEEERSPESGQRWRFIVCLADLIGGPSEVIVDIFSDPYYEGHVTPRLHHGIHVLWVLGSVSPSLILFLKGPKLKNDLQSNGELP